MLDRFVPREAIEIFERKENNTPSDVVSARILTRSGKPCSARTARHWHWLFERQQQIDDDNKESPVDFFEEKISRDDGPDGGVHISSTSQTIKTPEDLIAACKIDMKFWKKDRAKVKTYQGARRAELKDFFIEKGRITGDFFDEGKMTIVTLHSVELWLSPRVEAVFEEVLDKLLDRVKTIKPAPPLVKVYPTGQYSFFPSIFDPHFGRLSLDGNYTLDQAMHDFDKVTDALLGRALTMGMPIDEIVIPLGNDIGDADNLEGTTTRGTKQHLSAGMRHVIDAVVSSSQIMIEKCVEIAPVHVKIIEGNHDRLFCYWLGRLLQDYYSIHKCAKYITVDNEKHPRKYHRFHNNLIGMEHGDRAKEERLPLIMAEERKEEWGQTNHRTWFRGHFHQKKISFVPFQSFGGVEIITMPALCPSNEWETIMAFYKNKRAAEGHFFHAKHGHAVTYPVFVDDLQ